MDWMDLLLLATVIGGFVYLNNKITKLNERNEAKLKELEAELSRRVGKVMNSHLENIHKINLWQAWQIEGESGRHDMDGEGR